MSEDEVIKMPGNSGMNYAPKPKKKLTIQNRRKFDLAKAKIRKKSHGLAVNSVSSSKRAPSIRKAAYSAVSGRKVGDINRKTMSLSSGISKFFSKRYTIISEIGSGGTATIFKAKDKMLDTLVAIKFLPRAILSDLATQERFKNEARIAMHLAHENIARLFHFDIEKGRMYLVMEYVNGDDFRKVIDEYAPLDIGTIVNIVHSLSLGLDYAHRCGVCHRDLKPENIMLSEEGKLKIIDFGTARGVTARKLKTEDMYLEGTPTYAAPEQFQGADPKPSTDIYSMGAIVQELLTSVPIYPFEIDSDYVLDAEPEAMPEHIPEIMQLVIKKALEKNPEDRWSSAGDFYQAFYEAAAQGNFIET